MKRVYIAKHPTEAYLVKNFLDAEGIESEVRGEALFGALGELPITEETLPSVWILEDSQLDRAVESVRRYEKGQGPPEPESAAFAIPDIFSYSEAAPLLCAGAIGYRSLKLSGLENGQSLGLTGFGASAHLVLKMAKYLFPQSSFFVFARSVKERKFAEDLGACWSGDIGDD